jgi:hypothetical protein
MTDTRRLAFLAAALGVVGACTPQSGSEPAADSPAAQAAGSDAVSTAASAPPAGPIPAGFVGRWDAGTDACAGRPGEMRIEVAPDRIRFHESLASVEAARPAGDGALEVDLAFAGEGEVWRETRMLRLLPGGQLEIEAGSMSATRVRCEVVAED